MTFYDVAFMSWKLKNYVMFDNLGRTHDKNKFIAYAL
jgi:hypothetical protein